LCCLAFTIHLSLLGDEGLTRLARLNHAKAVALAKRLSNLKGVSVVTPTFFNEFSVKLPKPARPIVDALAERGILAGIPASRLMPHEHDVRDLLIVAVTESASDEDCDVFVKALAEEVS